MPEIEKPRNWFRLITPTLLTRAGPGREPRRGDDVYAGQPASKPGDSLTKDVLEQAERMKDNQSNVVNLSERRLKK